MALLGVIGEAMQCLEDLAVLSSSWDSPWQGLGHYLRATEWTPFKTNNFWQEAPNWSDERMRRSRLPVICRDPDTGSSRLRGRPAGWRGLSCRGKIAGGDGRCAGCDPHTATQGLRRPRRRLEAVLAHFLAYKHGGLTLSRSDLVAVDDDVEQIDEDTPIHDLAIAVWRVEPERPDRGRPSQYCRRGSLRSPQDLGDWHSISSMPSS